MDTEDNSTANLADTLDAFDKWWHHFGSGIRPLVGHDASEHAQRVARISWLVASQFAEH
jgi:hypothetical protein